MGLNKIVRGFILGCFFVFLWPMALPAGTITTSTSSPAARSSLPEFSRYFPVWTQGYLEVRNLNQHFGELRWLVQLIDNPAEAVLPATQSSQPAPDIARQFDEVLRQNLNISSAEFLNDLVGQHFVLGWGGPIMRDQFGLLCRVENTAIIDKLLMANKAVVETPTTTQVSGKNVTIRTYRLEHQHIGAAVIDGHILILATVGGGAKASMFHGMIDLARGLSEKSLRENPNFRAACSNVKGDYVSLFAILTDEKSSLSAGQAGALFEEFQKNVSHIAIAVYPNPDAWNVRVSIQPRWIDTAFFPELPLNLDPVMQNMVDQEYDFVYLSSIDPYRWYRRIVELSEQGQADAKQYRGMIDLVLPNTELRENLLESLGPEMMVVVSSMPVAMSAISPPAPGPAPQPTSQASTRPVTPPSSRPTTQSTQPTPPMSQLASGPASRAVSQSASKPAVTPAVITPAVLPTTPQIALVVKTHNPTLMLDATDQVFNILAGFVTIHNFTAGSDGQKHTLQQESYHGLVLHRLDLGQILPAEPEKKFPGWKLELAWAQVNNYLLISSSMSLLHRLLDRAFIAPSDMSVKKKQLFVHVPNTIHWAMSFDPSKAASDMSLFRDVLIHFWQEIRGGVGAQYLQDLPVVLGIGTKVVKGEDQKKAVIQVAGVLPGYPAWRRLQVGDIILSINGEPIDPSSPKKDLQKKISAYSQNSQSLKMEILRSAQKMQVEIPLTYRNFTISIKSMVLLEKVLRTMARDFKQIELACTYTPEGQVHLVFSFVPSRPAKPTSVPAK